MERQIHTLLLALTTILIILPIKLFCLFVQIPFAWLSFVSQLNEYLRVKMDLFCVFPFKPCSLNLSYYEPIFTYNVLHHFYDTFHFTLNGIFNKLHLSVCIYLSLSVYSWKPRISPDTFLSYILSHPN